MHASIYWIVIVEDLPIQMEFQWNGKFRESICSIWMLANSVDTIVSNFPIARSLNRKENGQLNTNKLWNSF